MKNSIKIIIQSLSLSLISMLWLFIILFFIGPVIKFMPFKNSYTLLIILLILFIFYLITYSVLINTKYLNKFNLFIKRSFDIIFSISVLIICLPILIMVILLILINNGQPIIVAQRKIGKNKKEFFSYKFNTMKEIKGEYKITLSGAFFRKIALDELPQFWNVLKGDMSIVGPRPKYPYMLNQIEKIKNSDEIFKVKPGITGLSQIRSISSKKSRTLSFSELIKIDIQYSKKLSLLNDLLIIIKTVFVSQKGSNN